jgi:hypothetical protein
METVMRHPNGINTVKAGPGKVKRLRDLGWREDSETPKEVLKFQNSKTLEFIKSKQSEPGNIQDDKVGGPDKTMNDANDETKVAAGNKPKPNGRKKRR